MSAGGGASAGSTSGGSGGGRCGGREGDWNCGGCGNRNFAFRSLCNRCKQPRLLVDPHIPRDSKWLPRAGDRICSGCSNNNYASRKNCKKCGLPKEEAAMPAMQMAGMAMPAYANYMARLQSFMASASGFKMNFGMAGNAALQQQLLASANWPYGMAGRYRMQPSGWSFGNNNTNQFQGVPKDWRDGDWLCSCGFHNYSNRTECKECNSPVPSGIPSTTMKATASDTSSSAKLRKKPQFTLVCYSLLAPVLCSILKFPRLLLLMCSSPARTHQFELDSAVFLLLTSVCLGVLVVSV